MRLPELFIAGSIARSRRADWRPQEHGCLLFPPYPGVCCKGCRGRGAAGKVHVFGLLKRGVNVYTNGIPDAKSRTLLPIIESTIYPDSIVYSDNFASYDVLEAGYFSVKQMNIN